MVHRRHRVQIWYREEGVSERDHRPVRRIDRRLSYRKVQQQRDRLPDDDASHRGAPSRSASDDP